MRFERWWAVRSALVLMCVVTVSSGASWIRVSAQTGSAQAKASQVEQISAEELKEKITKKIPVFIIDVRAVDAVASSNSKIKGSLHIKPRRLKTRLAFPPLKDLPLDREIVTYCACPSEGTSIRAAQVLLGAGFKRVRTLKGGWDAWLKINGPVEPM